MTTSTMTTKGQVTIPLDVRQRLGLDAGDRIEFVEIEDGVVDRGAVPGVGIRRSELRDASPVPITQAGRRSLKNSTPGARWGRSGGE